MLSAFAFAFSFSASFILIGTTTIKSSGSMGLGPRLPIEGRTSIRLMFISYYNISLIIWLSQKVMVWLTLDIGPLGDDTQRLSRGFKSRECFVEVATLMGCGHLEPNSCLVARHHRVREGNAVDAPLEEGF